MIGILRNGYFKTFLGLLLIAVLALKSCDLFIGYYKNVSKSYAVEKTEDESNNPQGENSFDKADKKMYSCYEYSYIYNVLHHIIPVSPVYGVYSFSIFKEPLRDVLTPPPNSTPEFIS
ncbi:hypothetical protein LT679_09280 [Mucilaginibacter roseus]|uniref:Lipoprotein n=1 Tax=Mucilaginibacter roseus TaxID=1528868 RepID=A0ABS8U3Y8_9SPHI|nr:hypothetical protein [Mucilaginibacter roseus]MCD8740790.1 hypothetical protein [Mucilaginibacter roseus]